MIPLKRNSWFPIYPWVLAFALGCSALSPRRARVTDPLTAEQHLELGVSYESQGLTALAIEQFDAAIRGDRRDPPGWMARGNIAFTSRDFKKAESCFRRALRLDPDNAVAANNLAMVYLERGDRYKLAEQLARKAIDRGGAVRPYALETLARLYTIEGRFPEATLLLDEAESLAAPGDEPLRQQLARSRAALAPGVSIPTP